MDGKDVSNGYASSSGARGTGDILQRMKRQLLAQRALRGGLAIAIVAVFLVGISLAVFYMSAAGVIP